MKNNKIFAFALLVIFAINFASAAENDICDLTIELISQDPYPATPGSYVDLVFQVDGVENPYCNGAIFMLNPTYPFSLDEDDGIRNLAGSTYIANAKTEWMIPIKLRVDSDALNGETTLNVLYGENYATSSKDFEIEIEDARTNFDAVIQDYTSEEISIAIANTGKYTANSVVVRIPVQDGFTATSTDGQMVGNLDSGDYTIISFEISQDKGHEDSGLNFDVYYTDSLGERRIVNMELSVGAGGSEYSAMNFEEGVSSEMQERMAAKGISPSSTKSSSSWWIWILAIIVIGAGYFFYKKKKVGTNKKKDKNSSEDFPAWMKKDKGRKK